MRSRLALVTLAVTTLIVVSFVVPLGILVRRQAEDRALSRAESDARSIATALAVSSSFSEIEINSATALAVLGAFGSPPSASIHLPDGTVVGPGTVDDPDVEVARQGSAFTASTPEGAAVLVPVVLSQGTSVVRVGVSDADLSEGVASAWLILAALAVLLISIALAGADRLGRSIVDPVQDLRAAAQSLGAGNLGTRVRPAGPPEIAEVGRTFNDLAARLRDLLQAEREAAADISHNLRTPLTALRLQVESLPAEVRLQLLDDIALVESTVDRVITEARSRGEEAPRSADLAGIAKERAAFWSVLAGEQGRSFDSDLPDRIIPVPVGPADLETLLDTLLENVFAHTPAGAPIEVTVDPDGPSLRVEDGGPGFEAASPERGNSRRGSTGLGLDIVRRIAQSAGGSLHLGRSPLGGALVAVSFGSTTSEGPPKGPLTQPSSV